MKIFGENKLYDHIDKLNYWLNGDKTIITAELDMTNVCDNKCPKCTGFKDNPVSISYEEAINYIDQLVEMDVKGLVFTGGGEPLCNLLTFKVVEYAKKKGLDIGFITNGLAMVRNTGSILINNCTWIRISLDAGTINMYEQTHGMDKEVFDTVLRNIRSLVMSKGLSEQPTIGTAFLTGKETIKEMYHFVYLSRILGVDYAQFRPFHYDQTDISKELKECKKLETDKFKVLTSTQKYQFFKEDIRPYKKCYGANFRLVIAADSKVYICCHHRANPKYCLGDLKKQSLREIWEKRREIIDRVDLNKCVPFCVLDKVNRELWNMKHKREHINFL